jgi:hypothetical protein
MVQIYNLMTLMDNKRSLAIYDGLQVVKGEVNVANSTHQDWSTIILVEYETEFFTFDVSMIIVYQLIAANWTAPRQDEMFISPSGIESTSAVLSRSALQQLRKILLSYYLLN